MHGRHHKTSCECCIRGDLRALHIAAFPNEENIRIETQRGSRDLGECHTRSPVDAKLRRAWQQKLNGIFDRYDMILLSVNL
ncbi:hypothetical protein CCAX7_37280 [Capsulimonas corticalis]|uniref:Uncharacterized protein n=1 Tax=Capsulimonas corticalis TaxID=2219043 RepID=A0A402D174_9BACT|nr:hypothetical protein CCAX7_37280 [Capsulimonas corticalis]